VGLTPGSSECAGSGNSNHRPDNAQHRYCPDRSPRRWLGCPKRGGARAAADPAVDPRRLPTAGRPQHDRVGRRYVRRCQGDGRSADLIVAEYPINEGGEVEFKDGKPFANGIQTAEKRAQSFWIAVRNPGGRSKQPRNDNAIYEIADALGRLAKYDFPVLLNDTTRGFFGNPSTSSVRLRQGGGLISLRACAPSAAAD